MCTHRHTLMHPCIHAVPHRHTNTHMHPDPTYEREKERAREIYQIKQD